MIRPQTNLNLTPTLKIAYFLPQKVKNDHKIKSISNVRIEGNIKNGSCSTTRVDPKTVLKSYPTPKNRP